MFVVTVTFTIKPDEISAFLPLMQDNARRSLDDEPGCRHFDVCTSAKRPDEVFLYELYVDEAAFQQHLTMPHYVQFSEQIESIVAGKLVKTYSLAQARGPA